MVDRLRPLWDFYDLDATEQRLRVQLDAELDDPGRAEVLTQLARVEGLRDHFDACDRLLEQAEAQVGSSAVAKVRIDLERGRKLRSSGDPEGALPLFEAAFACSTPPAQRTRKPRTRRSLRSEIFRPPPIRRW